MAKMHKHWLQRSLGAIGLAALAAAGLLAGAAFPASTGLSSSDMKAVSGSSWSADAKQLRGQNGSIFTFRCPKGGRAHTIWGSGIYTDDSSVCTAAVHAGWITRASGGMVKIRIRPGRSSYKGTRRHGITSHRWGRWYGSFIVVSAKALPKPKTTTTTTTTTAPPANSITWSSTATSYRGQNGSTISFTCPAGGSAYTVWGTDTYTDDSSICTAAVHAGRIGFAGGGAVTIRIEPGLSSYAGTTRNGVTTLDWPSWPGSFVFA